MQGILIGRSPLLTPMARGVILQVEKIWPTTKRFYRFALLTNVPVHTTADAHTWPDYTVLWLRRLWTAN